MKGFLLIVILLVCSSEVFAQKMQYFQVKDKDDSGISLFEIKWYSKQLSAMNEPIIFDDTTQKEIYRFTWLRTFHRPIAIRIEKQADNYRIFWKECDGAGGYEPGKLIVDKEKVIDKKSWYVFINQINKMIFGTVSTNERSSGNDGAQWIMEGKVNIKYQVVVRWTPMATTDFYKCCDFLLSLTNLKVKPKEKY